MDRMQHNRDELIKVADNAYKYIKQNNNWDVLYDELIHKLIKEYL